MPRLECWPASRSSLSPLASGRPPHAARVRPTPIDRSGRCDGELDWARWFWKGAVHIDDVAAAVILGLDLLSRRQLGQQLVLTLDSAYEYTDADLDHWDAEGPGSTFRKYYPEYYDLALSYGLAPALKPTKLDISETVRRLGYKPVYSLANLLSELAVFGDSGPPHFTEN